MKKGRMERQERGEARRGVLFYLIPVFLLTVLFVSGGLFLRDFMQYRHAGQEYSGLESYIYMEAETVPETEHAPEPSETAEYFPDIRVDTAALCEINPDFSSVLYIPVLELQYPVAASRDNADYLHTTFRGESNYAGCIFLDANADGSYEEGNTFLFGHNMKDGSMFGKLKNLLRDPELLKRDPYIYLYTKDKIRKYRIFSCYHTTTESPSYEDFFGEEGYDSYVKRALSYSSCQEDPENAVDFTKRPRLLTLSTCAGRSGSNQRTLVHAALVAERPADSE